MVIRGALKPGALIEEAAEMERLGVGRTPLREALQRLAQEDLIEVVPRRGYFVNHDLAEYQVPVHADVPSLEVVFMDEIDARSSPMKAKGVGELGLCGVAAAVANAVYNACGVRVRDYPITLDKLLDGLPALEA